MGPYTTQTPEPGVASALAVATPSSAPARGLQEQPPEDQVHPEPPRTSATFMPVSCKRMLQTLCVIFVLQLMQLVALVSSYSVEAAL